MTLAGALVAVAGIVLVPDPFVPTVLLGTAFAAAIFLPPRRLAYLGIYAATTLTFAALVYGLVGRSDATISIAGVAFDVTGAQVGVRAAARLVSAFFALALAHRFSPPETVLPLLARKGVLAYIAGAMVRLIPQLSADARRIRDSQRARGHRFRRGVRAPRSWLPLLVPISVLTVRRAREQGYALRLAGIGPDPSARHALPWALIVSLAALAAAGRMYSPVAGFKLSFFVLFLSGVAFGPRVGALVGILERLATDWAFTGLFEPTWIVMAPLEGLLGAASGILGRFVDFGQRGTQRMASAVLTAGAAGACFVLVFSVAADTLNWYLLPLLGAAPAGVATWAAYVSLGLTFNQPSMLWNAGVFAIGTFPVLQALRAHGLLFSRAQNPTLVPPAPVSAADA